MKTTILTAEEAYVGALLWLDAPCAAAAHGWVTEDDLSTPSLQLAHRLVGQLADAGLTPDPAAVLSLAMTEGHVEGEHRTQLFALFLVWLFDHRATTPAAVRYYAGQALALAERRRTVEMSTRLAQVADHADLEELDRLSRAELAAVETIRARRVAVGTAA